MIATVIVTLVAIVAPERAVVRPDPAPPYQGALASWYDDTGATASGTHYPYGFASLLFGSRWGHRVQFCHGDRCVVGQLDDHGPYVSGRSFDLNAPLKVALGCSDLCWLRWREWRRPRPLGARLVIPIGRRT